MTLQIRQKLTLLVTVALATLICVGLFSFYQANKLNDALNQSVAKHAALVEAVDKARSAQVHFKIEVQEWKNILLRGKDAEAFNKYLKGFDDEERRVKERLGEVKLVAAKLGIAERIKVSAALATFEKLGPAYRDALKQYDRNAADPAGTVDKLVKGIDREPTKALDDLANEMQKISREFNTEESSRAAEIFAEVKIGLTAFSLGAVIVITLLAITIIRSIIGPLKALESTMLHIATNHDLTRRADIVHQDEIGRMGQAFNAMMNQLQKIIAEVLGASHRVSSAAEQLAGSSRALAEVSEHQSSAVASSASAVEELTVAIAAVADTADEVHALAVDSVERTNQSSDKVSHLAGEMERIRQNMHEIARTVDEFVKSTAAITGMTQEVRDIADQTNLLALNAAIEAARAGETGRGFAVVADEVRKLAEKSGKSASEIDSVTRSITNQSAAVQQAIEGGERSIQVSTALANEVIGGLAQSRDSVERSKQGVGEISSSVSEQKQASTEIAQSMERIANMVEENNNAASNISASTHDLQALAQSLSKTVSGFRVE